MRIVIAVTLFALAAFTAIDEGHIHVTVLTLLLGVAGLSIFLDQFRASKK